MTELTQDVRVAASVEQVWADLTTADVAAWFWPPRLEATAVVELEPDGRWEVRSEVADMAVEGVIRAVDPMRLLDIDWRWAGERPVTQVGVRLSSVASVAGQVTQVSVTHRGFASPEERDAHVQGWTDCLQRLVARHEPTP